MTLIPLHHRQSARRWPMNLYYHSSLVRNVFIRCINLLSLVFGPSLPERRCHISSIPGHPGGRSRLNNFPRATPRAAGHLRLRLGARTIRRTPSDGRHLRYSIHTGCYRFPATSTFRPTEGASPHHLGKAMGRGAAPSNPDRRGDLVAGHLGLCPPNIQRPYLGNPLVGTICSLAW